MSGEMDEESHHCRKYFIGFGLLIRMHAHLCTVICEKTVTTACYWNLVSVTLLNFIRRTKLTLSSTLYVCSTDMIAPLWAVYTYHFYPACRTVY
jgi:hypothetical protein